MKGASTCRALVDSWVSILSLLLCPHGYCSSGLAGKMQSSVIIKRSEPENMEVLEAKEDCKQFLLPIISKMQEDITSYTRVQGRAYIKSRSKPWKMDSLLILMLGGKHSGSSLECKRWSLGVTKKCKECQRDSKNGSEVLINLV